MRRIYMLTPQGAIPFTWDPRHGIIPPRVPFRYDAVHGSMSPAQLAGLGSFLKKVTNAVHSVVTAPIRAISPDLAKPLDKLHEAEQKLTDKITTQVNNDLHKLGKWAKKNWKWIILAAAIVLTIYTMGATSGLVASIQSGMQTMGTYIANHAVSLGLKAASMLAAAARSQAAQEQAEAQAQAQAAQSKATLATALALQAMERLLAGAKIGDLSPEEVEAVATVNGLLGVKVVPDELLKYFVQVPGGASAIEAVQNGEMDLDPVDTAKPATVAATQAAAVAAAAPQGPRPVVQGQTSLRMNTSAGNAQAYAQALAESAAVEANQQAAAQASINSWAAVRGGYEDPAALFVAGGSYAPTGASYGAASEPVPQWVLPVSIAAAGMLVLFLMER